MILGFDNCDIDFALGIHKSEVNAFIHAVKTNDFEQAEEFIANLFIIAPLIVYGYLGDSTEFMICIDITRSHAIMNNIPNLTKLTSHFLDEKLLVGSVLSIIEEMYALVNTDPNAIKIIEFLD
jgi:hypothetical protein